MKSRKAIHFMIEPNSFKDKKVLFFAPKFFGYGQEIANKLQKLGCIVHYFDEKPNNKFVTKALVRVNKKLLFRKIQTYYRSIFKNIEDETYDFVFFLTPESISSKSLRHLKSLQPEATFILYMWDSLKNRKNVVDLISFFDYKYSFDKNDCSIPELKFQFRPLFFLDEYKIETNNKTKIEIDILFIGTVHSDRLKLLNDIKNACTRLNKKTFFFMFFPSKIIFYFKKLTDKSFHGSNIRDFEFKPLAKYQIVELVNRSRAILDIQHPSQSGLTMRVIEMFGAKQKVITTNKDILTYDFYNANNILYLDRENLQIENSFFESDYVEINESIYFKYSLDGWLQDIFSKDY